MTKEQYKDAIAKAIATGKACGVCQTSIGHELNKINDEYIASLEAENAKLEKLNSAALEQLSYNVCPSGRNSYAQPCNDSDDCVACWREYLLRGKK